MMLRRGLTVFVGAVVVMALSLAMSLITVPYVVLGPGPTVDTLGTRDGRPIITVTGTPTSKSKGHLNLTTVSVTPRLSLGSAIRAWLDGSTAVVPTEVVYPPGETRSEVNQQNAELFKESQSSAETAALRVLGYPVRVLVSTIAAGSPSAGRLAVGDVLTSVDGKPVTSGSNLRGQLGEHQAGQTVAIGYRRTPAKGAPVTGVARITLARGDDGGRPLLRIETRDDQPHPFDVSFDLERIGGSSAGLMFALGVIDKVRPADLTGGKFIAGTGEIDDDGNVGAIGGIAQKMVAARRAGATVFLAPAGNCEDTHGAVPDGLRVVKVETLAGALDVLDELKTGGALPKC